MEQAMQQRRRRRAFTAVCNAFRLQGRMGAQVVCQGSFLAHLGPEARPLDSPPCSTRALVALQETCLPDLEASPEQGSALPAMSE